MAGPVLVTGGAGFVGSAVVRRLVADGLEPVVVLRPHTDLRRIAHLLDQCRVEEIDLEDPAATELVEATAPSAVIHLAWYAEPGRYLADTDANARCLRASRRLLGAAARTGARIVAGGTCLEGFGDLDDGDGTASSSAYAAAKRAQHEVVERLATTGTSATCAHLHYLHGPWEDSRRLVPAVVRSLLGGDTVDTTDGTQVLDYIHVDDAASALVHLAGSPHITGGVDVTHGEVEPLAGVLGRLGDLCGRPELVRLGARSMSEGDVRRAVGDPTPLRRAGWAPELGHEGGLAATVAWWRQQQREGAGGSAPESPPAPAG